MGNAPVINWCWQKIWISSKSWLPTSKKWIKKFLNFPKSVKPTYCAHRSRKSGWLKLHWKEMQQNWLNWSEIKRSSGQPDDWTRNDQQYWGLGVNQSGKHLKSQHLKFAVLWQSCSPVWDGCGAVVWEAELCIWIWNRRRRRRSMKKFRLRLLKWRFCQLFFWSQHVCRQWGPGQEWSGQCASQGWGNGGSPVIQLTVLTT